MPAFDCIVIGVGGFGSGVLDHLARRGVKVLGLERFGIAHDRGSSHGQTRIVRQAYFEHPDYVPLCRRAYELWAELQADAERTLWDLCGLMLAGPEDGEAIAGAKLSAKLHQVPIESLTAQDAAARFPGFRIPAEFSVVYERDAGMLFVEDCVRAHVARAIRRGASVRDDESVVSWESNGRSVTVTTNRGTYSAATFVITPGAWAGQLLPGLPIPLQVVRKPQFWHATDNEQHRVEHGCPGFLFERPGGVLDACTPAHPFRAGVLDACMPAHPSRAGVFYGFPSLDGRTMKIAEHSGGQPVDDPLAVDRNVYPADTEPIARFLTEHLPGVDPIPTRHAVCMYTLTPDRHFIVDFHPESPNVIIGCGFSGHGFKFTPVLGEAMADLATVGRTDLPIEFLSLRR
jgi:sarcosine oxidase